MAVQEEVYSLERYLVAGSVMTVWDQQWFSLDDIDARAHLASSLKPEVESLEAMDMLETYYSPVEGDKYRLKDEYYPEFKRAEGYFNAAYGGNLRQAVHRFDEQDRRNLSEEIDIIELLT